MFAMSYYGASRVVPNYNVMGPVKAALEAACRYLAYELGDAGVRVVAAAPGSAAALAFRSVARALAMRLAARPRAPMPIAAALA
jgi:enoyl-[acyl-carrier protein] reductase I